MIIAGLGVVFMAVAFQLYLVNRTVTRTLGEVHATMLSSMFQHNSDSYEYNRETVKVIWAPRFGVPSANEVPRLGLFQNDLDTDLRLLVDDLIETEPLIPGVSHVYNVRFEVVRVDKVTEVQYGRTFHKEVETAVKHLGYRVVRFIPGRVVELRY